MNTNEGPQMITHPSTRERVCSGCKHLDKEAFLRGHNEVTDNYYCTHPDFSKEKSFVFRGQGRIIHYNHAGNCSTPNWCPFLKVES